MLFKKSYKLLDVKPGMQLGAAVFSDTGRILLQEGVIISDTLMRRLAAWGIEELKILTTAAQKPTAPLPVTIPFDQKNLKMYLGAVERMKQLFSTIDSFQTIPVNALYNVAQQQIVPLVNEQLSTHLLNLHWAREDYFYSHCVNVALLSGKLGKWLNYSKDEIQQLVCAGLLHDIGKKRVPSEILNKQGRLSETEMRLVSLHSTYSYSLISTVENLNPDICFGVLQHHERLDGSGYPGRFAGAKIHRYAKIIAVADIYDAMTSDRIYSNKVTPFLAADELAQKMITKLDTEICTVFLNNFSNFVLGNLVQTKCGREGEIIHFGNYFNASPLIRCSDGEIFQLNDWQAIQKTSFPLLKPS